MVHLAPMQNGLLDLALVYDFSIDGFSKVGDSY
jgi:hypothetical protein